ncbi:hypothetical protein CBR_g70238 [Chara braunii]|uniref:MYND-type domain-containing protein n=1 Tax=Chara braunii TaxID=69332 RepID=A0A388MFV7_CHABU|nr:hypothetical protein CBR_g69952 [Chara braunii]GBG93441.1 hypothetical protein CBR_g70238 [Chara braunii]|eukprot:GBG93430.1 hypothetical protein CBR_g69952 [Chara braunii]
MAGTQQDKDMLYGDGDQSPVAGWASTKMRAEAGERLIQFSPWILQDVLHCSVFCGRVEHVKQLMDLAENCSGKGTGATVEKWLDKREPSNRLSVLHLVLLGKFMVELGLGPSPPEGPIQYIKLAEYLISKGARVNARDWCGQTPLHYATGRCPQLEIARMLVDNGADVDAKDRMGVVPIADAVFYSHVECCRFLVDIGADPSIKNAVGLTAVDMCNQPGCPTYKLQKILACAKTGRRSRSRQRDGAGKNMAGKGSQSTANPNVRAGGSVPVENATESCSNTVDAEERSGISGGDVSGLTQCGKDCDADNSPAASSTTEREGCSNVDGNGSGIVECKRRGGRDVDAEPEDDYSLWTIQKLLRHLEAAGVNIDDCLEKTELVAKARELGWGRRDVKSRPAAENGGSGGNGRNASVPANGEKSGSATVRKEQCSYCKKKGAVLKCSRCKTTFYCNQACQKAHWSVHKRQCPPKMKRPGESEKVKDKETSVTVDVTSDSDKEQFLSFHLASFLKGRGPIGINTRSTENAPGGNFKVKIQTAVWSHDTDDVSAFPMLCYNKDRSFHCTIPPSNEHYSRIHDVIAEKGCGGIKAYFDAFVPRKGQLTVLLDSVVSWKDW